MMAVQRNQFKLKKNYVKIKLKKEIIAKNNLQLKEKYK